MLWIKAFHIIAVVCWFAGIFYLPRLFVYHAATTDQAGRERFKVMERKLYRGIMTPSAAIAIVLGAWLLIDSWDFYRTQGWMHAKLTMVLLLALYHIQCYRYLISFRNDKNIKTETFFRWFNEIPVLLLVGIIIMVIVRPF
ncbi:MAG TPA: protoporphyrinogen oxidase HemJ [Pseudomonadales bacterium]